MGNQKSVLAVEIRVTSLVIALSGEDEGSTLELGVRLLGRGTGDDVRIAPLALMMHGGTTIGTSVTHTLTLTNDNGSSRTWKWAEALAVEDAERDEPALAVVLDPPFGEIPAGESVTVEMTMTPMDVGMLKRTLTFETQPHGYASVPAPVPVPRVWVHPKYKIATRVAPEALVVQTPTGDDAGGTGDAANVVAWLDPQTGEIALRAPQRVVAYCLL